MLFGPLSGFQGAGPKGEAPSKAEVILFPINVGEEFNPFIENAYLVVDPGSRSAILIDPGSPDNRIDDFLSHDNLRLQAILNTHGHLDHTSGNEYYARKYKVKAYAHVLDRPMILTDSSLMVFLAKAGRTDIGGFDLRIIHVPGHTPGSVVYLIQGSLFTGDTLFRGAVGVAWGRTKGERERCLKQEVEGITSKLLPLPADTPVYPGHGDMTTLGMEKENNPLIKLEARHRSTTAGKASSDH